MGNNKEEGQIWEIVRTKKMGRDEDQARTGEREMIALPCRLKSTPEEERERESERALNGELRSR